MNDLALLALVVAVHPASPTSQADEDVLVAFVNVGVVSMQDEVLLEEQTVLIQGDRILSIGASGALSVPPGATVIDGSNRYLMPGLVDMHVHVHAPFDDGPLYLDAGITTVLALGIGARADTSALAWQRVLDERERSRTPEFLGPNLYTAGPWIRGGETPAEAERIVRENAAGGFDVLKVHGDVSPESFDRLHEVARQLGLRVIGHAQHKRGIAPVYAHRQDLAHLDEYLDAEFNPKNPGLWVAIKGALLSLILLTLTQAGGWVLSRWNHWKRGEPARLTPALLHVRWWARALTVLSWLLLLGLEFTLTDPFAGLFAGKTAALIMVCFLMLLLASAAIALTWSTWTAWRDVRGTTGRTALVLRVGLVWVFVLCCGYLTPRSWRTTQAALVKIAQDTAAAGIWVNPTLVVNDYFERVTHDEFYEVMQRPEMRFIRPELRDSWINQNPLRRHPDAIGPLQLGIKKNYNVLLFRLLRELHEAHVPLLAGSDSVGRNTPGVFPGSSLHEELSLYVQVGLSPYEALLTATVNPAIYLNVEQEVGKVVEGFRADLVLLTENPLDDIRNTRTRVGVMKRGRWFPASELEAALERLAEARK